MAKLSKRKQLFRDKVDAEKFYPVEEAITLLKELSTVKFAEGVDCAINLGVDPRKSDQVVRGATVLPHGTGKDVRVAVFTQGANADAAKDAGADLVGMDELADEVKKGNIDFDVVVASPDAMRVVGQLGQILGPRGLMPNPKLGTVTSDVEGAVNAAKAGEVQYRAEKAGVVHAGIGKASFDEAKIVENAAAFIDAVRKARPTGAKGQYIKKITISSTMGAGVFVEDVAGQ